MIHPRSSLPTTAVKIVLRPT